MNRLPRVLYLFPPCDILHAFLHKDSNDEMKQVYEEIQQRLSQRLERFNKSMSRRLDNAGTSKGVNGVGDQVLLRTNSLQVNKLTLFQPRYIYPFEVKKTYCKNALRLNLDFNKKLSQIFIVSEVKHYKKPFDWILN
jgi:hypothetical protein